jgi:hypothetical protein
MNGSARTTRVERLRGPEFMNSAVTWRDRAFVPNRFLKIAIRPLSYMEVKRNVIAHVGTGGLCKLSKQM